MITLLAVGDVVAMEGRSIVAPEARERDACGLIAP
jgi:hypothetical protein